MKFLFASRFLKVLYVHPVYYKVNVKLVLLEVRVCNTKGTKGGVI